MKNHHNRKSSSKVNKFAKKRSYCTRLNKEQNIPRSSTVWLSQSRLSHHQLWLELTLIPLQQPRVKLTSMCTDKWKNILLLGEGFIQVGGGIGGSEYYLHNLSSFSRSDLVSYTLIFYISVLKFEVLVKLFESLCQLFFFFLLCIMRNGLWWFCTFY